MAKKQKEEIIKQDELAKEIIEFKDYYEQSRLSQTQVWRDCYKAYQSWVDTSRNPFLANLFIPKTHEAVELISAFLIGNNQSITVEPSGNGKTKQAEVAQKLLNYQWEHELNARLKIITFVKQGILFGNGILKTGWDNDGDSPFLTPRSITDVFFDFYTQDIQDSTWVIDRILKTKKEIKKDEKYNEFRNDVVTGGDILEDDQIAKFGAYDTSKIASSKTNDRVELYEAWSEERLVTVAPTTTGWKVLRDVENPYKDTEGERYIPFVKFRFKPSPLPNRAYDIGAIEPTIKIQKAFNDLINEFFDNVSLINNKMWIKRSGATISPMDIVRRPGGIITVGDINLDIRSEEVSDIKPSILEAIRMLDSEFQQASMVVDLLKGVQAGGTATESALAQQNTQTMLNIIDGNIKDALSELGGMVLNLNTQFMTGKKTIKIFDNDREIGFLTFKVKDIKGEYDVKIRPDRELPTSKAVQQKQLMDFLAIAQKDPIIIQRYPELTTKIYKKWLQDQGIADVDYFFEEKTQEPQMAGATQFSGAVPSMDRGIGMTSGALEQSVSPVGAGVNVGNM